MATTDQTIAALKEQLRKRFHDLQAQRKPILAQLDLLREQLNTQIDTLTPVQERPLRAKIKELSAQLYPIDVEIGSITKMHRDPDGKSRMGKSD